MDSLEIFRGRLDSILSIESRNGLRQCTKETLTEGDLTHVANLLKNGAKKEEWAKRPRLFAILYIIGCMQDASTMDQFVRLGYRDVDLPFGEPLPPPLKSHKARISFKENQKKIFTGVSDLEKGKGHQTFEDGDKYYSEGRQLGIGAYAYVYEVFSQQSFENFARKMFQKPRRHDEALRISKAVADEVEHLKGLSHRHLIKFVGSYTDMKYVAILTQPVARCNLMEFLSQSPLPAADESRLPCYFGCLANALQYLHARGIKHKDLKPGNILVSTEGKVLITDFGSATSFWETGQSTTMGPEFTMTVDYAPREVMESKPRNTKVDVYSLGAVFFEMWTVWKGESISNMKLYFSKNGSNGGNIRTNSVAVAEWSEQLTSLPGHLYKNEPIKYIRKMIQDDPKARPDMDEIVLETVGSGQTSRFCCLECMSEYSDDGYFRRFHATPTTITIPRSNTNIPEIADKRAIAESSVTIARTRSEITNPPGTAESSMTAAIPISQPSGTGLAGRLRAMYPNAETVTPSTAAEYSLDTAPSELKTTTSKTTFPVQPAGTPEPVSQKNMKSDVLGSVERDVKNAFKEFALQQRSNIVKARAQNFVKDKEMRLADLKKFGGSFKLNTPIPADLVNILAKDPSKQKEIQEAAKRNAEGSRTNKVYHEFSPNSKDRKFIPPDRKAEAHVATRPVNVSTPLPHIAEVPNRAWFMPAEFDWTEMEMLNLVRLKTLKSAKDFRKEIINEFPQRSGTNVKKFWIAFCQANNLRTAI